MDATIESIEGNVSVDIKIKYEISHNELTSPLTRHWLGWMPGTSPQIYWNEYSCRKL